MTSYRIEGRMGCPWWVWLAIGSDLPDLAYNAAAYIDHHWNDDPDRELYAQIRLVPVEGGRRRDATRREWAEVIWGFEAYGGDPAPIDIEEK